MAIPTRSNVLNPTQWGFHARLGDLLLRLSASPEQPYQIARGPAQTDTVTTARNPEDFTDNYGRTFSQTEFTGGEGRRFAQRRTNEDQNQTKFWKSFGLKLNRNGDLEMVNTVEEILADASLTNPQRAAYDGTDLWVNRDSTSLTRIQNLEADNPTTSSVSTGFAVNVTDVVSLGGLVYACNGVAVRNNSGGPTTFAQVSPLNVERMWRVKDRVVGSTGPDLYDDVGGADSLLISLPNGREWLDVVDGGRFVWAVASSGTVYSFSFDGSSLALQGETEFHQEEPKDIAALYGRVYVITTQKDMGGTFTVRLWEGTEGDSGTLENLQVLREWFEIADFPRTISEPGRDQIFWDIVDPDTGDQTLYTYTLQFGAVLSDIRIDGSTGLASEILRLEGKLWTVNREGAIWRETATVRSDATFVGPAVDFFTSDEKVWDSLKLSGEFQSDSVLRVSVTDTVDALDTPFDDSAWIPVKTYRGNTDVPAPINGVDASRFLSVRVEFENDPVLQAYSIRGLPPLSDEEITLRINVSDEISRPGKRPTFIEGYGDEIWREIRKRQGDPLTLELYDLGLKWKGTLTQVQTPVEKVGPRGSVTREMTALFRGNPVSTVVVGDNVWGLNQWGLALWGGTPTEDLE